MDFRNENTNEEIHQQLKRMMHSKLFKSSRVLSEMLRFLVTETLEGREAQLKGYTVARGALGCTGLDEKHLTMVRIYAGRLRKLLQLYYSVKHDEDQIVIKVPKGTYKATFEVMPEPGVPTLIL